MKKETIKIEWSCDICGKNTNHLDIHTCIVPVLQSGHHDEYGGSGMTKKKMNHAQKVILQYHLKNMKQAKLFHEKNIHISMSLDYAIFAIGRKLEVAE